MSPTMQDPKFEMIMSSESDLEEGEILEFDYSTPKGQHEDGEIPDDDYDLKHRKVSGTKFKMKSIKDYLDEDLVKPARLPKTNSKLKEYKLNFHTTYKSSSSDIEYIFESKKKSGGNQKHLSPHNKDNLEKKSSKPRHGLKSSYGTVEDIMTQIDQTLCRKSRCHYKRRKSKEKYSSDRSQRSKSPPKESKVKNKYYKYKKSSSSDSNSDSENFLSRNKKSSRICKRKREKESNKDKDVIYLHSDDSISDDSDTPRKRNCTEKGKRDFDEYRKQLLEKLSKEKSNSKLDCENIPLPDDDELSRSSDIQEIEMMDDTNAFVDDTVSESSSTVKIANKSAESSGKSFMDAFYVTRDVSQSTSQPEVEDDEGSNTSENEDDDTELIKLRLLALTSNRKKKDPVSDDASSHSLDFEQSSNIDAKSEENEENSCDTKEENDADLDRNELLLRAEALKTALLKKHQKRMQKTTLDNKRDSLNDKNSEKNSLDNVNYLLKVEDDKLNLGEEINISIRGEAPEISNPPLDLKVDENKLEEILTDSNCKTEDKPKEFSSLEIARSKLPVENSEMSSLEIARRKLPRALEKTDESSKLEIARRKLPRNLEKLEKVSSLEIARRKLLKVRNALNQKNSSVTSEEDVSKDSLQARLMALANETILPPPLFLHEPRQEEQKIPQDSNSTTVPPSFTELLEMSEENSGEIVKTLVGKSRERKLSKKQLKRLKYKERKRLQRVNKKEKILNEVTVQKNIKNSTKVEDEDEKLRVQLLNDLDKRKNLIKDEDNNSNDKAQLPNSQLTEKINENKLLNKKIVDKKNTINNSTNAPLVPKVPKAEVQRIIIHLGPDSSDDEDEDEDKRNYSGVKGKPTDSADKNVPKVLLPLDIEKSVELLLQKARQEVEGKQGKNQNNVNATPEAVYKHLPPSQRLEYIRLKQKIAEKENLKKKTAPATTTTTSTSTSTSTSSSNPTPVSSTVNSNSQNLPGINRTVATSSQPTKIGNKSSPTSSNRESSALSQKINSSTSPIGNNKNVIIENSKNILNDKTILEPKKGKVVKSPVKAPSSTSPVKQVNKVPVVAPKITSPVKKIVTSPLNGKKPPVSEEQKKVITMNQSNISRLKLLLKNIKIEKTLEERYEKEIQKLQSQLNLLELKRKQQRLKIARLAKESKLIYASFQSNREGNKEPIPAQNVPKENDKTEVKEEKEEKDLQPKNGDPADCQKPSEEVAEAVPESTEKTSDVESKSEPKDEGDSTNEKKEIQNPEMECCERNGINPALIAVDSSSDLKEYNSPLQAITARTEDSDCKRIDPNTIMCQFDLLGKCNDEECTFQHYRT